MTDAPDALRRARRRTTAFVVVVCVLVAVTALILGIVGVLQPVRASEQAAELPTTPVVDFHSPDGITGCRLSRDGARCDLKERTWPTPAAPAECPQKWGDAVQIRGAEPGPELVCQEESLVGVGVELPYGQRLTRGDFLCSSREAAIRCVNTATQHGFSVSRDDYTPF